jgi:predicted transcriptional regulator
MATQKLQQEMLQYFLQLSEAEKKSVLQMIKTFLKGRKQKPERISIEQYNKEIDEAEAEIERGEFYTHEEVVEMSKKWVHGK